MSNFSPLFPCKLTGRYHTNKFTFFKCNSYKKADPFMVEKVLSTNFGHNLSHILTLLTVEKEKL
jgi:hypothetical protein